MKSIVALALALASPVALAVATPAHAADVKTIGCVEQGMDANARKLLVDDLQKNLENAGGQQSYRPETITAIQTAAKACQAKYGWTDAATSAAILYTLPKLGWPLAVRMGKDRKVDANALAKRVNALSPEDKAKGVSDDVLGVLAKASLDAGEINADNAAFGGAIYGLLVLQAKSLIDFQNN